MLLDYPEGWEPDRGALKKELEECGGVFGFNGCSLELALKSSICTKWRPCPRRVSLYARMGLHRFNLLQGRKFQLDRVEKYVYSLGTAAMTYYITLEAVEGSSLETFEIEVSEDSANTFALMCDTARIQERQDNDDWIRLYVELAVAIKNRASELKFEILKVAMDVEPPNDDEGLNAKNATFYIRYKDLHEARLGRYPDRIAIVRRSFDEEAGSFNLVGETRSLEIIQTKRKFAIEDTGCISLKGQNQSSEFFQFCCGLGVYKPFGENKRINGLPNQISSPPRGS